MQGEFSCQARNLAGLGNKCHVRVRVLSHFDTKKYLNCPQVSGPVASLVAETDLSFIIIGACFVVFLTVMIVLTIITCRRIDKHDYPQLLCKQLPNEWQFNLKINLIIYLIAYYI